MKNEKGIKCINSTVGFMKVVLFSGLILALVRKKTGKSFKNFKNFKGGNFLVAIIYAPVCSLFWSPFCLWVLY